METKYPGVSVGGSAANADAVVVPAEISTSHHATELIGDNGGMRETITALVAVAAACSKPYQPQRPVKLQPPLPLPGQAVAGTPWVAPAGGWSEYGRSREANAIELTAGAVDINSKMVLFVGPPDATTLFVYYQPFCNEETLKGMTRWVDGPKGFRARGFKLISCYPNMGLRFAIPEYGAPEIVDSRAGWFCANLNDQPLPFTVGNCVRELSVCNALVAQPNSHLKAGCVRQEMAYCSRAADGFEICFTNAEGCVHFSAEGGSACKAKT